MRAARILRLRCFIHCRHCFIIISLPMPYCRLRGDIAFAPRLLLLQERRFAVDKFMLLPHFEATIYNIPRQGAFTTMLGEADARAAASLRASPAITPFLDFKMRLISPPASTFTIFSLILDNILIRYFARCAVYTPSSCASHMPC